MKEMVPILTVTGSDSTGGAGVQADIRTIAALGGYALSVVTAVTVQNSQGVHAMHTLPDEIVVGQLRAIMDDVLPRARKVGMVRSVGCIRALAKEVAGCSRVVFDPGLVSSRGERLADEGAVAVMKGVLLPRVKVLTLKCAEVPMMLGREVEGVEDMLATARELLSMGPEAVLLQGGRCSEGVVTDVLVMEGVEEPVFFTSPDTVGWNLHGVGGTLSSAIATFLGQGDGVEVAVRRAHQYLLARVVFSVDSSRGWRSVGLRCVESAPSVSSRQVELYNQLMALVAEHYGEARDVAFYAEKMCVTAKYLSQITRRITGKSPKQVIADYLMREVERVLTSTSLTVQEIAYRYGFASQSLFCKFFHHQRGCSPTEFRNTLFK